MYSRAFRRFNCTATRLAQTSAPAQQRAGCRYLFKRHSFFESGTTLKFSTLELSDDESDQYADYEGQRRSTSKNEKESETPRPRSNIENQLYKSIEEIDLNKFLDTLKVCYILNTSVYHCV